MATTLGTYGHAQVLGFSEDMQSELAKSRAVLKKVGIDADAGIAQIQGLHTQVVDLNTQQESLKKQLKATTAVYQATREKLYIVCSGWLDTAMAAVEKNSPTAKILQRLRSRIRKPRGPTTTAIQPVELPPS